MEKLKLDREKAEFDHKQNSADMKQKTDKAIVSCCLAHCVIDHLLLIFLQELLGNGTVDASVKQAASDFLKRLFASD